MGEWPTYPLDHIDSNRSNNTWFNLRAADNNKNAHNRNIPITNTSGIKGLRYDKGHKKLKAYVGFKGNNYYKFFSIEDKDLAITWLKETRLNLHKEFANHG